MRNNWCLLPLVVALGLAAGSGESIHAGAFQNGSFEANNPVSSIPDFSTVPAGWTKTDPTGGGLFLETYTTFGLPTLNADGTTAFGFGGNGATSGNIAQTFDTVAGAAYLVSFQYVIQQGFQAESLEVDALDGANPLASSQVLHFTDTAWAFGTLAFTASSSQTTLRFSDLTGAQDGQGASTNWALDGVSVDLTSSVSSSPEPATFGLVGFACLVSIAGWRRRQSVRGDSSLR